MYFGQVIFMQSKVKFNFSQAKNLSKKIDSFKTQLDAVLEDVKREITNMPDWWEGESQIAFNERNMSAITEMASRLETITDLSSYIIKVSNEKDNFETRGKNRF